VNSSSALNLVLKSLSTSARRICEIASCVDLWSNINIPKFIFLALAVFAVLVFRRPDQFLNPYMWAEDGVVNLPQYLAHGWLSLFYPVQGYIILPTKIIFVIAAKLSFLDLPVISYWLTMVFTFCVVAAIAFLPTYLKWPMLCALAVVLVPTDSEVFAVPLYALWWGTLLSVVPLLWREENRPHPLIKTSMVLFGGLSSPMIVGFSILYAFRFIRFRTRTNAFVLTSSVAAACAQIAAILYSGRSKLPALSLGVLWAVVRRFFGCYVAYRPMLLSIVLGICVFGFFLALLVRHRKELNFGDQLLLGCFVWAILAITIRIPATAIQPIAGARYFFFPFIFLSWIFLQLAAKGGKTQRLIISVIFLLTLRQTALIGQRFHEKLDWRSEVMNCAQSDSYELPIHWDGNLKNAWHVKLSGSQCRQLISDSLFDRSVAKK